MGEDPSEVRHQVEQARENLGDTVEALAYKANAPKRLKDGAAAKVQDAKGRATSKLDEMKERLETDPRAAKLRDGVQSSVGNGTRSDRLQRSARDQVQNAVATAKRHPEATAAAIGMAAGIVIGRKTARD